jgi:hypothetical protein
VRDQVLVLDLRILRSRSHSRFHSLADDHARDQVQGVASGIEIVVGIAFVPLYRQSSPISMRVGNVL